MSAQLKSAPTKVVTGKSRFSYCNIFEPRVGGEGQDAKYSVTLLIPKSDTVTVNKIKSAQEAAIAAKWPNKRPPKVDQTMHDGDGTRPSTGEPFGSECKGHYVITVSSKQRPGVVDEDRNEILDKTAIASGDYGRASINFYAYDSNGKRGVSAGLNNIQWLEKGEALGGRSRAEDDFADNDSEF